MNIRQIIKKLKIILNKSESEQFNAEALLYYYLASSAMSREIFEFLRNSQRIPEVIVSSPLATQVFDRHACWDDFPDLREIIRMLDGAFQPWGDIYWVTNLYRFSPDIIGGQHCSDMAWSTDTITRTQTNDFDEMFIDLEGIMSEKTLVHRPYTDYTEIEYCKPRLDKLPYFTERSYLTGGMGMPHENYLSLGIDP